MTAGEWIDALGRFRKELQRFEQEVRIRQLADGVSEEEARVLEGALRNVIGTRKSIWKLIDRVSEAPAQAGT